MYSLVCRWPPIFRYHSLLVVQCQGRLFCVRTGQNASMKLLRTFIVKPHKGQKSLQNSWSLMKSNSPQSARWTRENRSLLQSYIHYFCKKVRNYFLNNFYKIILKLYVEIVPNTVVKNTYYLHRERQRFI